MLGVNAYLTVNLWGFLQMSYTLRLLIGLSLGCGVLALVNIRAKALRTVTYIIASAVLIVGLFYTIYCRRPLGFWTAISACIVIIIYFLSESGLKSRKDSSVTKMTAIIALVAVFVLTAFSTAIIFTSKNRGIENGPETMWDRESQAVFDEICVNATTDKEVAFAAYGQIWCCRKNKVFITNTLNIAQERDFYRIKDLNVDEEKFLLIFLYNQPKETREKVINHIKLMRKPIKWKAAIDLFRETFEKQYYQGNNMPLSF